MTNNTTAPERIWAKERYDSWGNYGHWYSDAKGGGIEYVRADALEAAQARIAELEEALKRIGSAAQFYSEPGTDGMASRYAHESHARIVRAALEGKG